MNEHGPIRYGNVRYKNCLFFENFSSFLSIFGSFEQVKRILQDLSGMMALRLGFIRIFFRYFQGLFEIV